MTSDAIGPSNGIDVSLGTGVPKPSRLHEAAQQFEALMIGEMLRAQREAGSDGWLGSGGGTGDDTAMDMAEAQFSKALAAGPGLGLAKMVEKAMSQNGAADQALKPPQLCTKPSEDSSGVPQLP